MIVRFFLFSVVVLCSIHTGKSQDILRDIAHLQGLLPQGENKVNGPILTTRQLDTILAVLSIYGQLATDDEQSIRDPQDIIRLYRSNPFIYPLLTRQKVFEQLITPVASDSLSALANRLQNPARQKILQRLSANDVYSDDRMLSVPVLQAEYATPPLSQQKAVQLQAKAISTRTQTDPADLTTDLLVGLADWITERAQEEFTMTFLSRLQEDLEKKNLQYLFPETSIYLEDLDVANYRQIIPNAKLAFAQDLRSLSLNVSNYLYKSNKLSEDDPAAFNFLLIYRLIDLSLRGIELEEVLAYARGEMGRRRFAAEKRINLSLGQKPETPAYQDLQAHYKLALDQLTTTYDILSKESRQLKNQYSTLPADPAHRDSFGVYYDRLRVTRDELKEFNYEEIFKQNGQYLGEAVSLLAGSLDYAQLEASPNFAVFKEKFLEKTPPPDSTNRAIGLTMTRHLLRTKADTIGVMRSLYNYKDVLNRYRAELKELEDAVSAARGTSESARENRLETDRTQLLTKLTEEFDYWQNIDAVAKHDAQSFNYLISLLTNIRSARTLTAKEKYLLRVKKLSSQQVAYLNQHYPTYAPSPLQLRPIAIPADPVQEAIDLTNTQFLQLKTSLYRADSALVKRNLERSYRNAARYETMMEAMSQLLYCLYVPRDSGLTYIRPSQLNTLLHDDASQQLFIGLLYQRISQLPNLGRLDPSGIASISSNLVQGLADYGNAADSTTTQRLVNKIKFASQAINTVVETPLLIQPYTNPTLSLQQSVSAFRKVPAINRELTELFVRSAEGEYRYAVNNVLNLVDLFDAYPDANRRLENLQKRQAATQREYNALSFRADQRPLPPEIRTDTLRLSRRIARLENQISRLDTAKYRRFRNNLFLYSHFMADVASANSPTDIQQAIQDIALPKGSSQNKRLQWTSIELNAYFGGSVAHERILDRRFPSSKVRPNAYSLFVPVGLSISKRISPKREYSLTLFLPIIDLGAVTAYRTDPDNQNIERLPKITFGNVLAPGAHLLFNFGKSPFFMGMGLQYGPNTREIRLDEELVEVEAVRYMLTFGIDVPIISFSRRR